MSSTDPRHRIRRALTREEFQAVLDAIAAASDPHTTLVAAVMGALGPLLADDGIRLDDLGPGHRVDPSLYAIPATQWLLITDAATERAGQWGAGVTLGMSLVDKMPSTYEDPDAHAPRQKPRDYRPIEHDLQVSRDACDEIAACRRHVQALALFYGPGSRIHLDAATSWLQGLSRVFAMDFGARTSVERDGHLSLFVSTSSGFVYAMLFHPVQRRCITGDCAVLIADDNTTSSPPQRPVAGQTHHEHTPSYPLNGPTPGTWSLHS